jgi:hypothetical protein
MGTGTRRPLVVLLLLAACKHAAPHANGATATQEQPATKPSSADPVKAAAQLSDETHALLRSEGDLLWTRWLTGAGPLPSSALADHPRLSDPASFGAARDALSRLSGADVAATRLLAVQLATLAVGKMTAAESDALDRARAQLAFAAPGDARPERGERDLDRLLTEEPDAKKRAAIALEEARAADPLQVLALARDAAVENAMASLGASWPDLIAASQGMSIAELEALAEKTLQATEAVASQAVAAASVRKLGITVDRLRRADLPRLVREAQADAQFIPGRAWPATTLVLTAIGAPPPPALRLDAELSPSKGARPLALLVDPPQDVRLSLRPSGGFEEQRATLHEGARALAGVSTSTPRWELAQLGSGAVPEAVATLFESLTGDPAWLREATQLRGEPLDDVVHTEVARRLLAARRAAAMVLFEIRRRASPDQTATAQAALYRGLLQRATFAILTDEDTARWALQADPWLPAASLLVGAVLSAQVELALRTPAAPWWKASAPQILQLWSGGRSLPPAQALQILRIPALDPAALAQVAGERLAYQAPDAPPPAQKPNYKYMQGDKRHRVHKKKKPPPQ